MQSESVPKDDTENKTIDTIAGGLGAGKSRKGGREWITMPAKRLGRDFKSAKNDQRAESITLTRKTMILPLGQQADDRSFAEKAANNVLGHWK